MIGYTTLGSNDVQASAAFYDQLFAELGINRLFDMESFISWGTDLDTPMFAITTPFNKEEATVGNGVMVAIRAPSTELVNLIHEKALGLGAVNEGDPGPRVANFYCAYVRDLDGNKLNFYTITEQA